MTTGKVVLSLAKSVSKYRNVLIPDLCQTGMIGVMQAVKSFDPSRNARLCTIAFYHAKYEMFKVLKASQIPLTLEEEMLMQMPLPSTYIHADPETHLSDTEVLQALHQATDVVIRKGSERYQRILESRLLQDIDSSMSHASSKPVFLKYLSTKYALSPQRIHQIEVDAIKEIRALMAKWTGFEPATSRVTGGCSTTEPPFRV